MCGARCDFTVERAHGVLAELCDRCDVPGVLGATCVLFPTIVTEQNDASRTLAERVT